MEQVSMESYLNDFKPSFENFLSKCPRKVKSTLVDDGNLYLEILDAEGKSVDGFNVVLNPLKPKKEQIKEIKEKLETFYPVIIKKETSTYSPEEIETMIQEGIPVGEAIRKKKETLKEVYKVVRIHHRYNEVDCIDLKSSKLSKFKLYTIPTSVFQDKILSNQEEMSSIFMKDAKFMNVFKSK